MLGNEIEKNLNDAFKLASKRKHQFVTVEHLFLSLLENSEALEVLIHCGADIKNLHTKLEEFISSTTPILSEEVDQEIDHTWIPKGNSKISISCSVVRTKRGQWR